MALTASVNELEGHADQPLAAVLTDIALRKGQICPGNTSQLFEKGLNQRAQLKMQVDDNARNALQALLHEDTALDDSDQPARITAIRLAGIAWHIL